VGAEAGAVMAAYYESAVQIETAEREDAFRRSRFLESGRLVIRPHA